MQGKVALVTGAAQGLGRAIGERLLQRGARVCLSDIDADKGFETTKAFQQRYGNDSTIFMKCDVTSDSELSNTFSKAKETMGGLDIVCNNAGIMHEGQWEKMLNINLTAVIRGTFLGIEHMSLDKGGRGGVIINMSSIAGVLSIPFGPVYAASKHGVVGFSRSMGDNTVFTKQGIRVNCLCPAFTDTDILKMTKEQAHGLSLAIATLTQAGVQPVSAVSDAFMRLIDDSTLSGAVYKVTLKDSRFLTFSTTDD